MVGGCRGNTEAESPEDIWRLDGADELYECILAEVTPGNAARLAVTIATGPTLRSCLATLSLSDRDRKVHLAEESAENLKPMGWFNAAE